MRKNFWLLLLGLGIVSATLLVDHFFVRVPDWLAVVLLVLAVTTLIAFYVSNGKKRK